VRLPKNWREKLRTVTAALINFAPLQKVRQLEKDREAGRTKRPGKAWTVEAWLMHWLDNIAAPSVRTKTLVGYETAIRRHLIPGLGGWC
jgi:hypothetical protein